MRHFYPCGLHQYRRTIVGTHFTAQNGMISLDCNMAGVYRLLPAVTSRFATLQPKCNLPVHKILSLGAPTLKCCSQLMDFNLKELTTMERTS